MVFLRSYLNKARLSFFSLQRAPTLHYFRPLDPMRQPLADTAEAMGFPHKISQAADRKKIARQFIMANHSAVLDHLYDDIECMTENKPTCYSHGEKPCKNPKLREDVMVFGIPCQPFSDQHPKRKKGDGSVRDHPLYNVMFQVIDTIALKQPRTFIIEEVTGFSKPIEKKHIENACKEFMEKVSDLGIYNLEYVEINPIKFINMQRPRTRMY